MHYCLQSSVSAILPTQQYIHIALVGIITQHRSKLMAAIVYNAGFVMTLCKHIMAKCVVL